MTYDVVYYWCPNVKEWRTAEPGVWPDFKSADKLIEEIRQFGFHAVLGARSIGPPDGPPESYS